MVGTGPEAPPAVPNETSSFDEIYAAHYGDLTVQLYAYFGDRQEAQDVVQEAFCRAYARWRTASRLDDPVAWIRRVAWNLAISRWRHKRTVRRFLRSQRPVEPNVDGPEPERVALIAALATLPDNHRRAIVLRYLADLTVADIADREGVPEGTVKSWLHRARQALAARLDLAESAGATARNSTAQNSTAQNSTAPEEDPR
ncbi:SigE family RNA polymerase sigma factor [Actinoplanes sp. KI2]|uniref:RNA polymerase sigma factor n=1 Tax=Actinoplanes sp. KI2 TaxID=2983315 RepID=UPI0021D5C6CC|nr:SigE family RNA polymerase sigma factor [Actinoplanes sp. KI2]MCU7728182.1 SigE family RNA polymerase sigma factor [Actinoplanes sp. KI2]